MKVKFRFVLCVVFILSAIISTMNIFDVIATAQMSDNHSSQSTFHDDICYCGMDGEIFISLETEQTHFLPNENIVVSYLASSGESIRSFKIKETNFNVINMYVDESCESRILVELSCLQSVAEYSFVADIQTKSGKAVVAMLYAISNEYGSFISPFSIDDARERYFDYAKKANIITEERYELLKGELGRLNIIEEEFIERTLVTTAISTLATSTKSSETVIKGLLQWKDDSAVLHPLRRVMVKIYDKEVFGSSLIATVYSDNSGNFSYVFDDDDGILETNGADIFIRVYAGTNNAMVQNSNGSDYYYESSVSNNISSGTTITKNMTTTMTSDLGRAFQISQAVLTARDYAWNMMGEMPSDVKIRYPYGSICSYNRGSKYISITGNAPNSSTSPNSYAAWDVVMHEYGHHIQHEVGIIDSPGGNHASSANNADDRNNKDEGIRLAWAESWPTVFGIIAQRYYGGYLSNIATVGDTSYTSYNGLNYDLESTDIRLGEACERSIMAILWDLFDSSNDNNDTISLGYINYWDVTTRAGSKTFSDFLNHFYGSYPSYIDDIAPNLTYYKMSSTAPIMSNFSNVSQTISPNFNWVPQGGSSKYPNNRFALIFYDGSGKEILRTATTTIATYTLTQSEWNSILYSDGKTYQVTVAAMQTDSPITGEFISAKSVSYAKPTPANITEIVNIVASNRYTERMVNLQPGQYIEYKVTFATGGTKLVQTFGNKDARIYIYNSSGTLLASDDDSGYNLNALISYYFIKDAEYIIKVQHYNSNVSGQIKLAITPAYGARNAEVSTITQYEDIYTIEGYTGYNWGTYAQPNYTRVITFNVPTSGNYKFEIESEFDTYIYVIDPRSSSAIVYNVNYNDDSGEGMNPLLTTYLDENVPYLVIYSAYNPNALTETTYLTLHISKS